jgi:hypothetical protein
MNCPLTCNFCFYGDAAQTPRLRFERLVQDIVRIRRRGYDHFYFMDPNFILSPAQHAQLQELRDTSGLRFTYYCQVSPNVLTESRARQLAASGCRGMVIGIENREQIVAKGSVGQARQRIEPLLALGMMPTLYFMIDGRNDVRGLIDLFEGIPFQYTILNSAFASDRSLTAIEQGFSIKARLAAAHAGMIAELRQRPNYIGSIAVSTQPSLTQAPS